MGFYKTRYANRRRATRYRRKTYGSSRYRPRYASYKKRRFVYNKANKAEWKQTDSFSTQQALTIPASTYGTALTINPSVFNSMVAGANPGQRIGRKLNANFIKLRWQADLVDVAEIDSMCIRFFAIQVKGNPSASPNTIPFRVQDIFTQLSSGAGDTLWQLASIAPFKDGITNSCRILFDRTYKLDANSNASQIVFKRKIRMQPLSWEIDSSGNYNNQASNPVFFYWIVSHNAPPDNAVAVPLNIIYRLVYTDS